MGLLLKNLPAAGTGSTIMNKNNKNNLRLDAVALLDEFAYRFYQELDYQLECQNGLKIRQ
jgi:predicted unusual protein kinase regulating ubiquinone biosynthesis (AarF/ABC1/UbiB family)